MRGYKFQVIVLFLFLFLLTGCLKENPDGKVIEHNHFPKFSLISQDKDNIYLLNSETGETWFLAEDLNTQDLKNSYIWVPINKETEKPRLRYNPETGELEQLGK